MPHYGGMFARPSAAHSNKMETGAFVIVGQEVNERVNLPAMPHTDKSERAVWKKSPKKPLCRVYPTYKFFCHFTFSLPKRSDKLFDAQRKIDDNFVLIIAALLRDPF